MGSAMPSVLSNLLIIIATFSLGYFFRRITLRQKRREQEISNKLYATFEASLDGIIIIDDAGDVLEFSESAETIFGYKRDDIRGQKMADLIVPERYRDAHNAGMARMRETGVANILGQRIEIEAIRANGEEFMSELAISRSQDNDRDIFIAYIRDITEKKAAETALNEAKLAAEAASEAKSKFLATMSHELRTPFNAVVGILGILEDTRLFRPGDIVGDVQSLFGPIAASKNVQLALQLNDDLESALLGDAGRIKQVLFNFVSNAVKFTKEGSITITLNTVELSDDEIGLKYSVKDTGIGISEEIQQKLFDEFYMVDASNTRETGGTGLGLAISKKLVHLMGGEIGVESQLGGGSTFWMTIPLERTVWTEQETKTMPSDAPALNGAKILLAEDNKTNQLVTNRVLSELKADVTIAENGQEVLDLLAHGTFDMILMDISMPVMGGLEATKKIRKSKAAYRDIPIIALTAMASVEDGEKFQHAGMNEVLIKPVKKLKLAQSIAEVLGQSNPCEIEGVSPEVIKELLDGVTTEEFDRFKFQFQDDLVGALKQLKDALDTKDREKAEKASHILKGLATTFGFSDLSETAALTNTHCKSGKNNMWMNEGQVTEGTGQLALENIDAAFDLIEVSAA